MTLFFAQWFMDILLQVKKKGLKLAEQLKRDILKNMTIICRFLNMNKICKKQMNAQPILYSLVTGAVSDAYKKNRSKR